MKASQRNIGLDVLRATAILGVFLFHSIALRVGGVEILAGFGTGVELFFVLSGFLIGRIYFRESGGASFSAWRFWRSRWWRTLPPYAGAVLLYLAGSIAFPTDKLHWYYAFFLQNYLGVTGFGPSWSLCVEEHFYLLLPVIGLITCRLLGRRSLRWVLPLATAIPLLLRFEVFLTHGAMPNQWYWLTHLHFEGLAMGVWLAYLFVEDRAAFDRLRKPALWLLPVIPITLALYTFWVSRPFVAELTLYFLCAVGYAAWVRYLYDLRWDPVGRIGKAAKMAVVGVALCSYSVYLTHAILDPILRNHIFGAWHRGMAKSLTVLSINFMLGVAFYFLVERPTILSRDRYLSSKNERAGVEYAGAPVPELEETV